MIFFLFSKLENILRPYLNSSTSYGRSTGLKSLFGLLLVSFIIKLLYGLEKKIHLNIYFPAGGGKRLSPLCPNSVDIAYVQNG